MVAIKGMKTPQCPRVLEKQISKIASKEPVLFFEDFYNQLF